MDRNSASNRSSQGIKGDVTQGSCGCTVHSDRISHLFFFLFFFKKLFFTFFVLFLKPGSPFASEKETKHKI